MGRPASTGCASTAMTPEPGCPSSGGCGRPRRGRLRAAWCRFEWPWPAPPLVGLEAQNFVYKDDCDASVDDLAIDDEDLVHGAVYAVSGFRARVFERERVLVDPAEALLEIGHDLLCPDDEDDSPCATDIRTELGAAKGRDEQRSGLRDGVNTAEHHVRRGRKAADLVGLGLAVHATELRAEQVIAPGLFDRGGDASHVQGLRRAVMNLRSIRDEVHHHPLCLGRVGGAEHVDSICLEGSGCPLHARFISQASESAGHPWVQIRRELNDHSGLLLGHILAFATTPGSRTLLHRQPASKIEAADLLDRLVAQGVPGGRGLGAWQALLRAQATLIRQLDKDLEEETGLALADFDVLAQLALAGGELRMTELADRALISRSGMTRRVARLVDDGLVRRATATADARGVVIALTQAGVERLAETASVHARGIRKLFVDKLNDHELAAIEKALTKVTLDCGFG